MVNDKNLVKIPKKRGRKPKNKNDKVKIPKKRGRKPKGGKIIKNKKVNLNNVVNNTPNIILHLKCNSNKQKYQSITNTIYNPNVEVLQPYSLNNNKKSELNFFNINNNKNIKDDNITNNSIIKKNNSSINIESKKLNDKSNENIKEIHNKINKLKTNLQHNNITNKRSACFWCTCNFDNPAIYIPKDYNNNKYEMYGNFCSPECAVSFLKKQDIDTATKVERYALLNNIYSEVYDYKESIKPAPNPFYTLDKYYGNLTIGEYRKLLKNDRILMVVDKPMTKILPELFEENNETPNVNNNLLSKKDYNISKLKRPNSKQTKSSILKNNFSLN